MADISNRNSIDDIVSGVHETLRTGELSSGGVKLEFTEVDHVEEPRREEKVVQNIDKPKKIESQSSVIEPRIPESPKEPAPTAAASTGEEEGESSQKSAPIWTTYLPRFTDVSDTYRMRGSESAEQEAERANDKKESAAAPDPSGVDPTAELSHEQEIAEATVVSTGTVAEAPKSDVSTVFKFGTSEPEPAPTPIFRSEPEPEPEPEPKPTAQEPQEEKSEKSEPYVMPHPDTDETAERLPAHTAANLPAEVLDEQVNKKKKKSEYNSYSERDGFLDGLIDGIVATRVRLIVATVLAFAILIIENVSVVGADLVNLLHFQGVSGAMAIITLPFVVCSYLIALPEVVSSFVAIRRRKLVPEIFLSLSFFVICLYYSFMIAFVSDESYALLGFVFALSALSVIVASYFKKKADLIGFKVISAGGDKKVVDRKLTRNLPAEHRALDGKIESYRSRTARVFKTNFVSDFSARSGLVSENTPNNLMIMSISLGVALLAGFVTFFIPGGIVNASVTFATVFMLACPIILSLTHKLPFYRAISEAYKEKSTVIGEQTLYDYSGIDVVTFDDTEIFGKEDVNLQRVMVYGRKENLPKALQQMSALFSVVGGPLAYIFSNSVDRRVTPADSVVVGIDGIIGKIDGAEVMAGSAEFMKKQGFEIPHDPTKDSAISQTTRLMYAAENGEVYAKFYIRYMLSEDFTMTLPLLLDEGVAPLVYTRDPNINNALFRSLTAGTDSIRVLKKQNLPENEKRLYQRISLGLVSTGDKMNIISTLLLSKKYTVFQSKMAIAEIAAMASGALLALILAICRVSSPLSLILGAWHALWCVALAIAGRKSIAAAKDTTQEAVEQEE